MYHLVLVFLQELDPSALLGCESWLGLDSHNYCIVCDNGEGDWSL